MWKFCRLYYMFMLKFSKYHSSKKTLVEIKIFPRKFHKFWHLWPRIVMPFMKIKLCCHNFPHQRFWKTIFSNSLSFFYIYIFEIPLAICKIKPSLVVLIFLRASKCYFCILIITRWIKFMFYIWGKIVFQMYKEPVLHFSIYIGIPKNLVETWTM